MSRAMHGSVLIVEQGFLRPRGRKPVHGVELFRLGLIRELVGEGIDVTVVAERSWADRIRESAGSAGAGGPAIIAVPYVGGVAGTGLLGVGRARGRHRRWDTVLFGNARLGLVPAMHYAYWRGLGGRMLLFAHRDPGPHFLDAVGALRFDVVANSEWVARWYRGRVEGCVGVMYGLSDAERFHPGLRQSTGGVNGVSGDGVVRFCLLGRLPNISKGQERAVAAFRMLPERVRERCRLHLASFTDPPAFGDPCIVAHPWMPAEEVGEFLRGMDVMLAVSTHETFSQAIVQGMLTGLPVIASDLPVYLEKLDPLPGAGGGGSARREGPEVRRGGLIARGAHEIARAAVMLAEDAALRHRLGEEGRRIALDRYVWDTGRFVREHLFVPECSRAQPG